ncbi:MAG: bifunctional ornithine acetyltransferase/N-acetylglutamate synthase, partial [Elusimicrobiota bacterium]|nr:bifunctional ornithine acetyltransferase/N-acetylglutamate synthase [Elusimicrobiota bacterium]
MLPKGFRVGSINAGISNKKDKKDLSLFLSDYPANVAALFTSNIVKAAPVLTDIDILKKSKKISALIANSGCANACIGKDGLKDAAMMNAAVEKEFALPKNSVLCASTGVIGQRINLSGLGGALKTLSETIGSSEQQEIDAALGIMTTDKAVKKI